MTRGARAALAVGLAALVGAVALKNAWLSDDAYISFRSTENLVHGLGLTWNTDERVQTFTNPLWTLLLVPLRAASGEIYFTSLALSLVVSLAAVGWVLGTARGAGVAVLVALVLVASRAFTDFATSGLENPLTNLLVAGFVVVGCREGPVDRRRLSALSLLAALCVVNRMDTLLVFLPGLLVAAWRLPRPAAARGLCLGFSPFLAWELFSLAYYGFAFPNTAYAKLNTGLSSAELFAQAGSYFAHSLATDPVTLVGLALGVLVVAARGGAFARAGVVGVVLYLAYVWRIGGDFMSGRFFVTPLFATAALFAQCDLRARLGWPWIGAALAVAAGLVTPRSHLTSGADYGIDPDDYARVGFVGIERAFYYQGTGLFRHGPGGLRAARPEHPWVEAGRAARARAEAAGAGLRSVEVTGAAGFYGFYAGPAVHVTDTFALAEPLLARLPADAPQTEIGLAIGHFVRLLPLGFLEAVRAGDPYLLADPDLADYYAELCRVTRGALWSRARWRSILRLERPGLDPRIVAYLERPPLETSLEALTLGGVGIPLNGVVVDVGHEEHGAELRVSLDPRSIYEAGFARGATFYDETVFLFPRGAAERVLAVPRAVQQGGFDRVRLVPRFGYGDYRLEALHAGD